MSLKDRANEIGQLLRDAETQAAAEGATETMATLAKLHKKLWKGVHLIKEKLGFDDGDITVFSGGGGKGDPGDED